jgi:hypothetical protein
MEKLFICKKGWARHSKGVIINQWEWKRLAIESREQFFEPYLDTEKVIFEHTFSTPLNVKPIEMPAPTTFEENLVKELEDKGIKAKFKHSVKDGSPALDATFTFDKPE